MVSRIQIQRLPLRLPLEKTSNGPHGQGPGRNQGQPLLRMD